MSQFSYIEHMLHSNVADFLVTYQITEVELMVMGNSKKIHLYLISRLHSNHENLMCAK